MFMMSSTLTCSRISVSTVAVEILVISLLRRDTLHSVSRLWQRAMRDCSILRITRASTQYKSVCHQECTLLVLSC